MAKSVTALLMLISAAEVVFGAIDTEKAEQGRSEQRKLQALNLPHVDGPIPVFFSPGYESVAQRYQRALISAQKWFDKQLRTHVDFVLAVLAKSEWQKATNSPYPMPSGAYMSPLLFLPARFGQDFPRIYEITEKPELLMEQITFHEAGHIYGDYLDYPEHDGFLSELIANIFSTAFIRAERPDLAYLLSGPPSKMKQQRYTSFADLEYLGGDVGMVNYGWFQFNVYRLTDLLLQRMNFAALLTTMRKLFPETDSPLFPEVLRRLESIRPGITAELGPLAKPTTIPKIPFGSCVEANMSGKPSSLVVENLSREKVTIPSGRRRSQDITPLTWRKIDGHVGEVLHIGPTRCWHFADEPSIAEIQP